jgi:uncharacterized damage-inducible protein DinB
MIGPAYCVMMARYNAWQNRSLTAAAETLDDTARHAARGAFFGSIAGTLSHLLWGDLTWMARFDGGAAPGGRIADSPARHADWDEWKTLRARTDARIAEWAGRLLPGDLEGDLQWHSGGLGRTVTMPRALCVVHFFNHQTHHRGQVHAMLTAAGARPGDTDLFVMPADAG